MRYCQTRTHMDTKTSRFTPATLALPVVIFISCLFVESAEGTHSLLVYGSK